MFDFSATEFLVIALVALIVIGPRELPGLLRQVGQMVGKVRRMASEFQDQLNTAVESSEIQELKNEVGKIADEAKFDMDEYDLAGDVDREINDAVKGVSSSGKTSDGKTSDGKTSDGKTSDGKSSEGKPEIHNPDFGNDPDDALVDFPETPAEKSAAASGGQGDARSAAKKDNAIMREPSTPRAAAPAKRLPVNAGNTSTAESTAAKPEKNGGKPVISES